MGMLDGKVAIITGASSGIGPAAARVFAEEGARLVLTARRAAELDSLVAEIEAEGGEARAVAGDIRAESVASACVDTAVDRFGGLDIAFNNAASLGPLAPTTEVLADDFREVLEVNLMGAFLGARHQIPAPLARGGGVLLFTSSFVGHTAGIPGMAAYAASKAGLIGLAQVLATELGPQGIRVNAVLPGGTDTEFGRVVADTPEKRAFVAGLHALKRIAAPDEIARAVAFLASDRASFITGTAWLVDGGVSITRT